MKKKDSKVVLIFFSLLLCGIAAAIVPILHADSLGSKNNTAQEHTSIRILACFDDNAEKYEQLLDLIDTYMNKNQNVSISATNLTGDEFCVRLMTDFSAAHEPDIVISAPNSDLLSLYRHGKLGDLTDTLQNDSDWLRSVDKSILRFVSDNDRIYGIPTESEYISLYTNKQLFDRCGLDAPQTLEEFKNVSAQLRSSGITPVAFGLLDSDMLLYQAVCSALDSWDKSSFFSDKALEFLKELYALGAFPDNAEALGRKDAQSLFVSGKCAMLAETSSFAGIIENQHLFKNPPFGSKRINSDNFDITLFPVKNSFSAVQSSLDIAEDFETNTFYAPVAFGAGSLTYFASKKALSDNGGEVIRLLRQLTSTKASELMYERIKNTPAVHTSMKSDFKSELIKKRDSLLDTATEFLPFPQSAADYYIWSNVFVPGVADFLHGSATSDELLQRIDERLNAIK